MLYSLSRLDGNIYYPENLSPELASRLLLCCPVCQASVFPVFGKKITSHFKHYEDKDSECELYFHSEERQQHQKRLLTEKRPPILQKMLSKHFYNLVFNQTLFIPRAKELPDHLGNMMFTRLGTDTGAQALAELPKLKGFNVADDKESDSISLDWLTDCVVEGIKIIPAQDVWEWSINNVYDDAINVLVKQSDESLEIVRVPKAAKQALEDCRNRTSPVLLQLILSFVTQKRQRPIIQELVLLAYVNGFYPTSQEALLNVRKSTFAIPKEGVRSIQRFFVESILYGVIHLLFCIPWVEFALDFNSGIEQTRNAIKIPKLGIPEILVAGIKDE